MRIIYLFIVLVVVGCSSDTNEIEKLTLQLELKEKEIALKVKEIELREKQIELEEMLDEAAKEYEAEEASKKPKKINTVTIGNLEVMTENLGIMEWDKAKKACAALGDGWRLPTKDELNLLYENKEKIGGFANLFYWSSTEYDNSNAWLQSFNSGLQASTNKDVTYSVRAVRAI